MSHKKAAFYEDIKDAFGNKTSEKRISKIAEDIKNLQGSFNPSKKYKKHLLKRLENIYLTNEALSEAPTAFSYLKMFSAVFSVFFISVVLFMVHDMRQENLEDILQGKVMISDSSETPSADMPQELREDTPEEEWEFSAKMMNEVIEEAEDRESSYPQVQSVTEATTEISSSENNSSKPEVNNEIETREVPQEKWDFMIRKQMPQDEDVSETWGEQMKQSSQIQPAIEVENTPGVEVELFDLFDEENNSRQETKIIEEMKQSEENMEEPGDEMFQAMPLESMMFDGDAEMMWGISNELFSDICASFSGSLSENGESCSFINGTMCTKDMPELCEEKSREDKIENLGQ